MDSLKERFLELKESPAGKAAIGVGIGLIVAIVLFAIIGMRSGLQSEDEAQGGVEASELVKVQTDSAVRNLSGGVVMDIDWDSVIGYDRDGNPIYATQRTVPTVGGYDMCGTPLSDDDLIVTGKTDNGSSVYGNYSAIDAARERGIELDPNTDIDWNKTAGYDKDNNPLFVSKDGGTLCYDMLSNSLKKGAVVAVKRTDTGLPIYDYSTIKTAKAAGKNAQKALNNPDFTDATADGNGGAIVLDSDMGVKVNKVKEEKPAISVNRVSALPGEQGAPKSVGSTTVGEKNDKKASSDKSSKKTSGGTKTNSSASSSSGSSTGNNSGSNSSSGSSSGSSSSSSSSGSGTSYGSLDSSSSSSSDKTTDSTASISSTEDKVVKYTVTFDPDNGKKVSTVEVEDGKTVTKPSDPEKDGYGFEGWYLDDDLFSFSTKIKKSITLKAHWKRDAYKVIFDWNKPEAMREAAGKNSYFTFPSAETFYAEYGKTYGESDPDFPDIAPSTDVYGYYFQGWYTGSTKVSAETEVMNKAITLTASWKPVTYKLTYQKGIDAKGSKMTGDMTLSAPASYTVEDSVKIPDPVIEGYEFTGWTYDKVTVPVKELVLPMGTVGDKTLVAHWTGNSITVIYDPNGGSGKMKNDLISFTPNACLSLCGFEKNGYVFTGWNTSKNGGGRMYSSVNGLILADSYLFSEGRSSVTLYAQWSANAFYVAFAGNNATSGDMAKQAFPYGEKQSLNPVGFTKTGYSFAGWALSSTGDVVYRDQASVGNLTDKDGETVTLYAKWEPITYNVIFSINDGKNTSTSSQKLVYDTTAPLNPNPFTRYGYKFRGWGVDPNQYELSYKDNEAVKNLVSESNGTITLYALWELGKYAVTFDYDLDGQKATKEVTFSKAFGTLPTKTRDGYKLEGWYTEKNGKGEKITADTTLQTEGATVYAYWLGNTYYIEFDGNYATSGTMARQAFNYGSKQTLNPVGFSKTGYKFSGWATSKTGDVVYRDKAMIDSLTSSEGAIFKLYAQWEPIRYTVVFHANNGTSSATATQEMLYDSSSQLRENTFTYLGHKFQLWTVNPDGSGDFYRDKGYVENLTAVDGGRVDLYARWYLGKYYLDFDLDYAGALLNRREVTFGEQYGTLITASRQGYILKGWYTGRNGSGQRVQATDTMKTEGATVYAYWVVDPDF